jgi:hypothetical protein
MSAPNVIFLQWSGPNYAHEEGIVEEDDDTYEGITWCEDRINDSDIEYCQITATKLAALHAHIETVDTMREQRDELLEAMTLLAKQTDNSCYFTGSDGKLLSFMEVARAILAKYK